MNVAQLTSEQHLRAHTSTALACINSRARGTSRFTQIRQTAQLALASESTGCVVSRPETWPMIVDIYIMQLRKAVAAPLCTAFAGQALLCVWTVAATAKRSAIPTDPADAVWIVFSTRSPIRHC